MTPSYPQLPDADKLSSVGHMFDAPQSHANRSTPISRVLGLARTAARLTLRVVYPPTCIACAAATGEAHTLCARCWSEVRFIERPFCERLGTPFGVDLGIALLSPAAIADPPVFQRARAVARYDDVARALVHRLKYGDRLELAKALGVMMARAGAELLAEADMIVPVPLHRSRLWWRRFNQAMALSAVVSRTSGVPVQSLSTCPR
jgi:predicted amidophosphoribosyltransferase